MVIMVGVAQGADPKRGTPRHGHLAWPDRPGGPGYAVEAMAAALPGGRRPGRRGAEEVAADDDIPASPAPPGGVVPVSKYTRPRPAATPCSAGGPTRPLHDVVAG